jgi:hypothetical protein
MSVCHSIKRFPDYTKSRTPSLMAYPCFEPLLRAEPRPLPTAKAMNIDARYLFTLLGQYRERVAVDALSPDGRVAPADTSPATSSEARCCRTAFHVISSPFENSPTLSPGLLPRNSLSNRFCRSPVASRKQRFFHDRHLHKQPSEARQNGESHSK